MTAIILLVPWMVTVLLLLLIIIFRKKKIDDHYFSEEDDQDIVRVAVYNEKAYWVYENTFYESDVVREPDFTTARPIDTMSLSPKQLNELLVILDELQEENERE